MFWIIRNFGKQSQRGVFRTLSNIHDKDFFKKIGDFSP